MDMECRKLREKMDINTFIIDFFKLYDSIKFYKNISERRNNTIFLMKLLSLKMILRKSNGIKL
jgi:hypothetical protein